ncbi:MAG: DUF2115 domain-containing protein [Methanobacterium paludis]|nr:DUF2115 domain-containing protein [Methanobacterium paludis]
MAETIEGLDFSKKISKNELMDVLKKEASKIHIYDIMMTAAQLKEDTKYLQTSYKENIIETFTNAFINRFKSIIKDKKNYKGYIDTEKLQEFLKILEIQREIQKERSKIKQEQDSLKLTKIAKITSIYNIFILKAPIHAVGTLFPGGFKLKFENGEYLCPVKEKQLTNPQALCRFCVSKQNKKNRN